MKYRTQSLREWLMNPALLISQIFQHNMSSVRLPVFRQLYLKIYLTSPQMRLDQLHSKFRVNR